MNSNNVILKSNALEFTEEHMKIINDYFSPKTTFALIYKVYNRVLTPILTSDESVTIKRKMIKKNCFPLSYEEALTIRDFGTEFVLTKEPFKNVLILNGVKKDDIDYEKNIEKLLVDFKTATDTNFNIDIINNIF